MGEARPKARALTCKAGTSHRNRAVVRSLALASCLFVIPLGASSAQTNELAAQFRDNSAPSIPAADTLNFAAQFEDLLPAIEPDVGEIDIFAPSTAVDLDTFEPPREVKPKSSVLRDLGTGVASYYGRRFHGRLTANGERFNMNAMTAAHKNLPFGTRVRVTNPRTGRSVTVRINDRGPFIKGRTIDLSRGAAERIGMISSGHARVKLDIVSR